MEMLQQIQEAIETAMGYVEGIHGHTEGTVYEELALALQNVQALENSEIAKDLLANNRREKS